MGMDFHSKQNRFSYTTRTADNSWIQTIKDLVPIKQISNAIDIGCGGGIYSKALSDMGVASVTGVDFSKEILEGAKENCKDYSNISFLQGNAFDTGVVGGSYDFVLERALIHHIDDLESCFEEAYRILDSDGYLIIQDRTPDDCFVKGSSEHIRGYFFEHFPKLVEIEAQRRHDSKLIMQTLKAIGFTEMEEVTLWETRKVYENKEALLLELRERIGRSILHELTDSELNQLVHHIDNSIAKESLIVEKDRWTMWKAVK
ncbi:Ubiquinone/menaquinone biosynthesis C-methylase UbiE [Oceanobacillus limi]|uniref:Ubiquinone/menaquinone biosynthesis C-methylase UbiE n=1 Tax=Oceanobacillus limi TaxID=930131 RepID=A0A1H9YCQ8_9BACI|nr:class I SAM-dependent methyltransferase [Oceanobacillus limi]SES66329.1 Ubiquinone/menaquinone biosynthesis C-methylase UbiE [Oceanobacillus limi]